MAALDDVPPNDVPPNDVPTNDVPPNDVPPNDVPQNEAILQKIYMSHHCDLHLEHSKELFSPHKNFGL